MNSDRKCCDIRSVSHQSAFSQATKLSAYLVTTLLTSLWLIGYPAHQSSPVWGCFLGMWKKRFCYLYFLFLSCIFILIIKKMAWCRMWITEVPWHWARIMWVWRTKTGWLLCIINPDNQLTVEPGKKRCFSSAEVFLRHTLAGKRRNLWVTPVHKKKNKLQTWESRAESQTGQVSEASAVEWSHQMLSATMLHDVYTVSKIFDLMGVVRESLFKPLKHMSCSLWAVGMVGFDYNLRVHRQYPKRQYILPQL